VESEVALRFSRLEIPDQNIEIWSASSHGFFFVISNESRGGPGLRGQPGFVASWRSVDPAKPAIRIGGSPFKTFAEAEHACAAMLANLIG
jgi:hypothetical protein